MLTLEEMTDGAPLPPVDPQDVKRVWNLILSFDRNHPRECMSFDSGLIAQHCSAGADIIAVFFRTAIIAALLQQGVLESWRDGDQVRPVVLEAIADFPLPGGIQQFDPEEFLEYINRRAA